MMEGRILAVDLGEKRIGLAVSDPTGTLASPLEVLKHVSGLIDAGLIAQKAAEFKAIKIIVGVPVNDGERDNPQTRHAVKFVYILRSQTTIPIVLWDESFSTNQAKEIRQMMNSPRKSRKGHLDDLAAAVILQTYLDAGENRLI
jgi:putative Holliday junction resolvase